MVPLNGTGTDIPAGVTDEHARETTGVQHPRIILSDVLVMLESLRVKVYGNATDDILEGICRIETKVEGVANWLSGIAEARHLGDSTCLAKSAPMESIRLGLAAMHFAEPTRGQPLDQPAIDIVNRIAQAEKGLVDGVKTETEDKMDFRENTSAVREEINSVLGKIGGVVDQLKRVRKFCG